MCYYVPLQSGSHKNYNGPLDAFWCCTGTGVENHAKYGDSIYFHDGGQVALREPLHRVGAELEGQGAQAPPGDAVPGGRPARGWCSPVTSRSSSTLKLRHPFWADGGYRGSRQRPARSNSPARRAATS